MKKKRFSIIVINFYHISTTMSICCQRGTNSINKPILILPNIKETDKKSVEINETRFIIEFGDIFSYPKNYVPVIPFYFDGMLFSKFSSMVNQNVMDGIINGIVNGSENYTITHSQSKHSHLVKTELERMPFIILYNYTKSQRLETELDEIFELCPLEHNIVFPILGINNGISFYNSAVTLFYSIIECLKNEQSKIHKCEEVHIVTLYNNDQDNSSVRAVKHLFNLINIYNKVHINETCTICTVSNIEIILNCGHYCMCTRCFIDIQQHQNTCPFCRTPITYGYPCCSVSETNYKCQEDHEIKKKICIPCGHVINICDGCTTSLNNKCPICSDAILSCIIYY